MTFRDMIDIAAGNLRRMKLRTSLTIAGVVIAIAAFVSMLSFGAGNQQYVQEQFDRLGLFSMVIVRPAEAADSTAAVDLTDSMLTVLGEIDGVSLVYPYDAFDVTIRLADTQFVSSAQALTSTALRTPLFSDLSAGHTFASDTAAEAMVTAELVHDLGIDTASQVLGTSLIVGVQRSVMDSALVHMLDLGEGNLERRIRSIEFRRLQFAEYRDSVMQAELGGALKRFFDGYLRATVPVAETLTVVGVLAGHDRGHVRVKPIILPAATARALSGGGFNAANPTAMLTALASGQISLSTSASDRRTYSQATIVMAPTASYEAIRDSVKAMGFETFSFAEQFKEIRRVMLYFNLGLGMIGLIALVTASLGIANTMIMSIIERTREIGMLKSLGAAAADIRLIFLVESGVIGVSGAVLGIVFGWLITRLVSAVAQAVMENEGIEPVELFALPIWLIALALVFGTLVSVLAGFYPAARAARVDPVQALRAE
ncbi:MAG: FtsX-like permease family protein [candidate division Zixibacteria bacterium]|jgi:putative ABC transport system permease protein|nr:FtsX-like permease family protein [candidate division Zixibacteria bacterium]